MNTLGKKKTSRPHCLTTHFYVVRVAAVVGAEALVAVAAWPLMRVDASVLVAGGVALHVVEHRGADGAKALQASSLGSDGAGAEEERAARWGRREAR